MIVILTASLVEIAACSANKNETGQHTIPLIVWLRIYLNANTRQTTAQSVDSLRMAESCLCCGSVFTPPSNSPWCGLPSLALSSTVLATIFSISIVRIRIPSSPDTFHSTEKIKTVVRMRMMVMMMTINVNFALAHTRLMVFLHGLMLNHPPSRAAPTWTLLVSIQCLACLPSCLAHSLARLAERRRDQFTTSVTFQPHTPHTHSHGEQSTLTGLQSGYEEYSCVECLFFFVWKGNYHNWRPFMSSDWWLNSKITNSTQLLATYIVVITWSQCSQDRSSLKRILQSNIQSVDQAVD